jgi:hypothetical protein
MLQSCLRFAFLSGKIGAQNKDAKDIDDFYYSCCVGHPDVLQSPVCFIAST